MIEVTKENKKYTNKIIGFGINKCEKCEEEKGTVVFCEKLVLENKDYGICICLDCLRKVIEYYEKDYRN